MTTAMHEPTALTIVNTYTRVGGRALGGRRWNVWYRHLRCPTCGREFRRLVNPLRGRKVRCVGSDRLSVTAKD